MAATFKRDFQFFFLFFAQIISFNKITNEIKNSTYDTNPREKENHAGTLDICPYGNQSHCCF